MEFDCGPGWAMGVHGPTALLPAVADATCMSLDGQPHKATYPDWPKPQEPCLMLAWPTHPHYATLYARCEEAVAQIRLREAECAAVGSELFGT